MSWHAAECRCSWCTYVAIRQGRPLPKEDAVEEVNPEISELRESNGRLRATVDHLQQERDAAREETRRARLGYRQALETTRRERDQEVEERVAAQTQLRETRAELTQMRERNQAANEAYDLRTRDWEQVKAQLSAVCGERDELEMQLATQKLKAEDAEELAADRLKSVRAHQHRLDERARKLNALANEIRLLERQARPFGDHAGAAETLKRLVELSKPWTQVLTPWADTPPGSEERAEIKRQFFAQHYGGDAKPKGAVVVNDTGQRLATVIRELEDLADFFTEQPSVNPKARDASEGDL